MTRIAVFAHWDKHNRIEDYVIYYLQELKKNCQKLIFVSDCDIDEIELQKIKIIADVVLAKKHGEYDFGSYKRGFLYAKKNSILEDYDELIFANDSCYAPMNPFEKMFEAMKIKDYDFWGITKNFFGISRIGNRFERCEKVHLQSYFLTFKKKVFISSEFSKFIESIKKEKSKNDVIVNYECFLTQYLENAGFTYGSYVKDYPEISAPNLVLWDKIIKDDKAPCLKTSILRSRNNSPSRWREVLTQHTLYQLALIEADLARNKETLIQATRKNLYAIKRVVKYAFFNIKNIS